MAYRYARRRRRKPWGPHATLELVLTAMVLGLVVAAFIVFLFVYHDLPFRLSGP
jgi:hypothetical protein